MKRRIFFPLILLFSFAGQAVEKPSFDIVALGVNGGVIDGNITSYLVRDINENAYLALDAGTLLPGIAKGVEKQAFDNIQLPADEPLSKQGYILRNSIKGYFISHGHLDHVSGMIISSTDDGKKPIYALPSVINVLRDNYFNWQAWPNFSDQGQGFRLSQYTYQPMESARELPVNNTSLHIQLWPLSHSNYESSMALIRTKGNHYFAYFGDTGPDLVEKSKHLDNIWQVLGPKVADGSLKGMVIEVSYPNGVEDKNLYGHLTPDWLLKELANLAKYSGPQGLQDFNVIISHIKPSLEQNKDVRQLVSEQLNTANTLGVKFHLLDQGDHIRL